MAIRALRRDQRFDSDEHLIRWCCRVAINLHVDAARRGRRFSTEPPPDIAVAGIEQTAETRMDLQAVVAGIAELSPEEQRVLLDPAPSASRAEAIRLAVRRHRIRARLAALIEGVVIGVPLLRRVMRSMSTPAKASLAAMPIVAAAGLVVLPAITGPSGDDSSAGPPRAALSAAPASVPVNVPTTGPRASSRSGVRTTQSDAAGGPSTVAGPGGPKRVVAVNAAGPPVALDKERRPDDDPTFCLVGNLRLCVDRPGPKLPKPDVPLP